MNLRNDLAQHLDDYVEAYEAARATGRSRSLAEFLPPIGHPERTETLIELVRVELEYSWQAGNGTRVEQYQQMFPSELSGGAGLQQVAFEEYRLRRLAGEHVAKQEYCERLSISTEDWPEVPVGPAAPADAPYAFDESSLRELSRVHPALANRLAAATRQMPDIGEHFESFDLVGELGRGAFGRVFLARQNDLARRFVALKITPQISQEPHQLAQLQHTNIVPVYSVHRQGSLQAICMPFLGPTTLADVLRTFELSRSLPVSGRAIVSTLAARPATTIRATTMDCVGTPTGCEDPVPESVTRTGEAIRRIGNMSYLHAAVWIMTRVADGMACAHEHGIVHRDLKPANILLTDDGEPLILDFNLATGRSETETAVALIGGTLPYMAPEHLVALRSGGSVGPASDVYSLGVILFQMLTGRLPYPLHHGLCDDIVPHMIADRRQSAQRIRSLNPSVSPGLAAIVDRCLAVEPSDRYPTARGLQEDLQRHLDHQPLVHAPDRSVLERIQKWGRRHPRLASASSVAVASGLIIVMLATAVWTRSARLAANQAHESLRVLASDLDAASAVLNSPFVNNRELAAAVNAASAATERLGISDQSGLEGQPDYDRLGAADRRQMRSQAVELLYLLAGGKAQQAVRSLVQQERKQLLDQALQDNALAGRTVGDRPILPAITLQRTRLLEAAHRDDEAEQLRQQIFAAPPAETDRRTLAFEWAQQNRHAEAAELLEQLIVTSPHDHTLRFCLGNCYLSSQQYDKAEESFTAAVALQPAFTLGYEHRGFARLCAMDYAAARRDLDIVLGRLPDCTSALINRAITCQSLGELQPAVRDLTQALESGCTETRVYFLRARIRQQLGDTAGAADDLREGLGRTPEDELSWVARGVARLDDQPHEALADFRQALAVNPRSAPALQNVAHVLSERLNDTPEAIRALDQLVAVEPRNARAVAARGVLLARQGNRDAALQDAHSAVQVDADPLITYQAGCIHALVSTEHEDDRRQAVDLIAQALATDPGLVEIAPQDQDLALLRDDETLRAILSAARALRAAVPKP